MALDFPGVGGTPWRPRELPDALYADRGFDSEGTRALLRWPGIAPHVAKRRTPHGSGLGKVRWVVERAIARLAGLLGAVIARRFEKGAVETPGRLSAA